MLNAIHRELASRAQKLEYDYYEDVIENVKGRGYICGKFQTGVSQK